MWLTRDLDGTQKLFRVKPVVQFGTGKFVTPDVLDVVEVPEPLWVSPGEQERVRLVPLYSRHHVRLAPQRLFLFSSGVEGNLQLNLHFKTEYVYIENRTRPIGDGIPLPWWVLEAREMGRVRSNRLWSFKLQFLRPGKVITPVAPVEPVFTPF